MLIDNHLEVLQPLYAPWEEPDRHRAKGEGTRPGRRLSRAVLVPHVRAQVSDWRRSAYEGSSQTTKALLRYWFDSAHQDEFRYHFCQREAIETIIWLYEVKRYRIPSDLFSSILPEDHPSYLAFTSVRPEEDQWGRYCSKLATGAGKTKCMSLLMAWSYFHSLYEPESDLTRNFVVIAPNLIVFERLRDDFEGGAIFFRDPVLPPEFQQDFNVQVVMQDDFGGGTSIGTIYLTNIHRLFKEGRDSRDNAESPSWAGPEVKRAEVFNVGEVLRNRISDHPSVMILNDEAHHLHDPESAWNEAISAIHKQSVTKGNLGVILQADFTATPKHNNGDLFRHIVSDFPLGEAVDAGIVKVPVIGKSDAIRTNDAAGNAFEKYRTHLLLGYQQYEYMWDEWSAVRKPILFVMCETAQAANEIASTLNSDDRFPLLKDKVLNLHTRLAGRIVTRKSGKQEWKEFVYSESKLNDDDLREIRRWSADLDRADSPYRCVVSVLMLREGWDVRNVTTIIPLRPYSAKSNILAEQTLGRGLRRMERPGPDAPFERVTVVEHPAFARFYEEELEQEGLDIGVIDINGPKPQTVPIFVDFKNKPVEDLELEIPLVSDSIETTVTLNEISFDAIKKQFAIVSSGPLPIGHPKSGAINFQERTLFTDEVVKSYEIDRGLLAQGFSAVSVFVKVLEKAFRLQGAHSTLAPLVQKFIEEVLFERPVSLFGGDVDHRLSDLDVREHIQETFAPLIRNQTIQESKRKRQSQGTRLSTWKAFQATDSPKRPCTSATKTLFNLVPCGNAYETEFAAFCDDASDVQAFAKNAGPQKLAIDYLAPSGRPALYWPDFLVRSKAGKMYLIETKGQEDSSVALKTKASIEWCKTATTATTAWEYVFLPQYLFDQNSDLSIEALARACEPKRKALVASLKSLQEQLPLDATSDEIRNDRAATFLAGTDIGILPVTLQALIKQAINQLEYDKRMSHTRYSSALSILWEPIEELCGLLLKKQLGPKIPTGSAPQDAYFDPYLDNFQQNTKRILADQARKLKRNIVHSGFNCRAGNFLFCLDFAYGSKYNFVQGIQIWDDVRAVFGDPELQALYDDLTEINEFRNKYIGHGDTPLTDPKLAEDQLRKWIDGTRLLYETLIS